VDPETIAVLLAHAHLEGYDMDRLLRQVACPTLLIQCDPALDGALEDEDAAFARQRLRRGTFVRLDGHGHMLHTEAPERLAALIDDPAWRTP
jgi:pimeloyl-ACP methyl ester carboxylesterase